MNDPLVEHLQTHFADAAPEVASVTFLGVERMDILRFVLDGLDHDGLDHDGLDHDGLDHDGLDHYVSVGCSRHPMSDPSAAAIDPVRGPRAEVVMSLRGGVPAPGLARSLAVVAATPAVDGAILQDDLLVDLSAPLWNGAPFTAVLLGPSGIPDFALDPPRSPVRFLAAVPITPTEAAWVRLKGAEAMRTAWFDDGVDVFDPLRRAGAPG